MHNKAAIWIRIVEIKSKGQYMENLSIRVDMVGKQANKRMNCTASVKDEVNSYYYYRKVNGQHISFQHSFYRCKIKVLFYKYLGVFHADNIKHE